METSPTAQAGGGAGGRSVGTPRAAGSQRVLERSSRLRTNEIGRDTLPRTASAPPGRAGLRVKTQHALPRSECSGLNLVCLDYQR